MTVWLGFRILWKLWFAWITFFLPEGLSEAFIGCKTLFYSAFLFQIKKIYLMSCVNAMWCMTLHEWNVCALDSLLWYFLLLNLPSFRPCTLCGLVGLVHFSSVLEDISVSMLAYRIVSHFQFLETKTILCLNLYAGNTGFFVFVLWLHNSCVVNKFCINNEKSPMQCK